MGKKNVIFNTYISQNDRFADLFNGIIFRGRQIVRPDALTELDSKAWRNEGQKASCHEYLRDHVKLWHYCGKKIILGLEPEENVHFALPVKYMNYESIQYDKEYKRILRKHRKKKDLVAKEYLSGFSQTDQLTPIITLSIYLGNQDWQGYSRLSDLTKLQESPLEIQNEMKQFCNDFHTNLFDIHSLESSDIFVTDLREVLGFLAYQNNKSALQKMMEENINFQHLKEDAYEVIAAYGNTKELKIRKQEFDNKEGFDMCLAIKEMIADGKAEGMAQINKLTQYLLEDGRMDDLRRSIQDEAYQSKLMEEYGIPDLFSKK